MTGSMTAWKRVPLELAERFLATLPTAADVERRQMFGCPCAFVNGNMFAGLHEDRLIVRLPDEAANRPAVILGKTMKQYALFPAAVQLAPNEFASWLQRGYEFTRALPAKAPKAANKAVKASKAAPPARPSVAAKAMKAAGTAKSAKVARPAIVAKPARAAKTAKSARPVNPVKGASALRRPRTATRNRVKAT